MRQGHSRSLKGHVANVVEKYKEMQEKRVEFALANCCVFELESLKEKPCG